MNYLVQELDDTLCERDKNIAAGAGHQAPREALEKIAKRLLFVDEVPSIRAALRLILGSGFDVRVAATVAEPSTKSRATYSIMPYCQTRRLANPVTGSPLSVSFGGSTRIVWPLVGPVTPALTVR